MSKDLNLCQFIGRLGKPPEVKQIANGETVANFSIACGDDYKKKSGEKVEQTNWVNIVVWGRLAEICGQYLDKGSQIYIAGKQVTRKWQDKEGNNRYTTEIVASEMQMLGSRSENQSGQTTGQPAPQAAQGGGFDNFDDDPF